MEKLILLLLIFNLSFLNNSYAEKSLNTKEAKPEAEKIYKIDAAALITENLFFPGAGHIYNNHLGSAFFSFASTAIAFSGYKFYKDNLKKIDGDARLPKQSYIDAHGASM